MTISAAVVKELRARTGSGFMDCKKALTESDGDMEKAVEYLQKKSAVVALKKAGRDASEGVICAYIHPGGQIGVLLEVNCETDFVARADDFQEFAKNIAMQVAAANPTYLNVEDIPEADVEKQKEIFAAQVKESGKPDNIVERIVDGKLKKWFKEVCLVDQTYIRDNDKNIAQLTTEMVGKTGENITISRFSRYQVGEKLS